MPAMTDYEIFAIRYGTRDARRHEHFIGGDPHDAPMPMDYFVWVARSPERAFVIDTGFSREEGEARKRTFLRCPAESVELVGLDPDTVEDVVITHLHYDHVGNFAKFPRARFHLQEREMRYATGRYMQYPQLGKSYPVEDVVGMVRLNFARRVVFTDGDAELAPGLSVHHVGGHTMGMQCVRVHTRRGWVVLASDCTHYYENWETNRPFPTVFDVARTIDGFRTLERLAESRRHVIPGHDPLVMKRYPAPKPELQGVVVQLDVDPIA